MDRLVETKCLCGRVRQMVRLKPSSPLRLVICHCNTCRWTSGALFSSTVHLAEPPTLTSNLDRYCPPLAAVSWYFCRNCGTHVYRQKHRGSVWSVASALVDLPVGSEQVSPCTTQRIADHEFGSDTGDGGLAIAFTGPSTIPAYFYPQAIGGSATSAPSSELFQTTTSEVGADDDRGLLLRAACHCGGVEFFLSRPNHESRECSSPWPDLLRPYHTHPPDNPDDVKWWIRGPDKYLAGTCSCQTCTLSNSTPITCWAFIPKGNLVTKDGSPIDFGMETLRSHHSSEGRTRFFCRICGASTFLRIDERPELIDVCMGLFRAPEGARAESWFDWCTDRVSFVEEAGDKELVTICQAGLKRFNKFRV